MRVGVGIGQFVAVLMGVAVSGCSQVESPSAASPAAAAPDAVSSTSQEIIGGYSAGNSYRSVALTQSGCSATVIGRFTALTAAHCVDDGYPGDLVKIDLNGDGAAEHTFSGTAVHHPSWTGSNWRYDIAIIKTTGDMSTVVTPARINTNSSYDDVGQPFMLVGYGCNTKHGAGYGTRRYGRNKIDGYRSDGREFGAGFNNEGTNYNDSGTCDGDSGGPSFTTDVAYECVIGVHSTAQNRDWFFDGADFHDVTVRVYASWIQSESGDSSIGTCSCVSNAGYACDGADGDSCYEGTLSCSGVCSDTTGTTSEVCGDFVDNDCNGSTDEGCACTCGDGFCCESESSSTCGSDCCEAWCGDGSCCPSSGVCSDGSFCMY